MTNKINLEKMLIRLDLTLEKKIRVSENLHTLASQRQQTLKISYFKGRKEAYQEIKDMVEEYLDIIKRKRK